MFMSSRLLCKMTRSQRLAHRRAISAIEFAIFAPVGVIFMVATADIMVGIRNDFVLEQVSSQMGEVISQCSAINSPADLSRFGAQAQIIAGNISLTAPAGSGNFIVTAIGLNSSGKPVAEWQYMGGNTIYGSILCSNGGCSAGQAVTLPNSYALPSGQILIFSEAISSFSPWIFSRHFFSSSSVVPHFYSMFVVRAPNPQILSTLGSSSTQGCGS